MSLVILMPNYHVSLSHPALQFFRVSPTACMHPTWKQNYTWEQKYTCKHNYTRQRVHTHAHTHVICHDEQCGSSIEMTYHVIWAMSVVITTLTAQIPYPKTSMKHAIDLHEGQLNGYKFVLWTI